MLDHQFPGWQFATVMPDYGPGTSPAWLAVDFDGDGRMDYAVQIVTPDSGRGVQRVLAFLRRGAGYALVALDSFPPTTADYLRRLPGGTARRNLDASVDGLARTFHLTHDGLEIDYGDQAAKTCWFAVKALRCALTGD
jgi:hypothetical protein